MKKIMKYFWRGVHILTSLLFIFCVGFLTYSFISDYKRDLDNFSGFVIIVESMALIANGGKCPLRKFHRKYEKDEELTKILIPGKKGEYLIKYFTIYTILIFTLWIFKEFLIN
ncbi:MAG: hypothetical protein KKB62_03005 [Nanoarchaeota archaeon]|nr:hypothetical protein [Nanoarchaeota archaeon]